MDSIIKKNLLKTILFFTSIILITFSIFLSIFIYKIKINDVTKIIEDKNKIITLSINNLFLKIKNYIEILSNDKRIISNDLYKEGLKVYKKLKKIDPDITYIYSGYENGKLLINNYKPPPGYDPRVRPWYKAAINAYPKIAIGVPYREIKTKEWLISFSKALKKNNKIIGVIAIDVSLEKVIKNLKDCEIVNCFIVNREGEIIINNNPSLLKKNYKELNINSKNKITYMQTIKDLGWTVITEIDKNKIFSPIIYQILICNLVILLITFIIGWGLSFSFSKKIAYPIVKLKERVEEIIENKPLQNTNFKYPQNEIGIIAEKIEALTQREIYKRNRLLKELSEKDQLTKLYNRRYMLKAFNEEFERAKRYNTKFSIILFDIDNFKQINDVYGHNIGDEVLKSISEIIVNTVRKTDKVSRWGGEEFLILCPETDENRGFKLAEKLRKTIENYDFPIDRKVTISGGVAEYCNEKDLNQLLEKADKKLYKAKNTGKNKIII